jgi:Ca2+:H+ antiporter
VGFIILALVGGASAMPTAFSGARKNRMDLSVGISLGSSSQIALFVAPVLVLVGYAIGPSPMDLQLARYRGDDAHRVMTLDGHQQRAIGGSWACC